jgi:homoserine kinase
VSEEKMIITVPASSANLGPGFDSIGLALDRYLTLEVTPNDKWYFHSSSKELEGVPSGEDNLIFKVVTHIAKELGKDVTPCSVKMVSNIPLARGLGSSASAIVAGIELVNQQTGADLSVEEKVRLASLWEGHPDNVSPSIYGGLVIGTHTEERTDVVYCGVPKVDLVMLIPDEELMTKKARSVLPDAIPYKQAVRASGVANVLVAAILQDNWDLAGEMMINDVLHQPYRMSLVPGLEDVMGNIRDLGGYGAALSGAGPAIICFTEMGTGPQLQSRLKKKYPQFSVELVKPAVEGIKVGKTVKAL